MKTKLLWLTALLLSFAIISCNDDDDNSNPGNTAVESAFVAKYPSATRVDWEVKGTYYVVDFWLNNQECEAWFSWDGQWHYTETDIRNDQLPEAVRAAYNQSEYASWVIDDVDVVERNGMEIVYVLEVKQGNQEFDLYYTADGTLVKAVADTDNNNGYLPASLPESASSYISNSYPNARIIEVDVEKNGNLEVDIVYNGKHLELQFTTAGDWVYTKTEDLLQGNVPQDILTALQNAGYNNSYRIDDIDYYETPTGSFYYFELESGSLEVNVKVTLDGIVTEVSRIID